MSEHARKILVVDDEKNMRIALFEALSRNGYDVAVAEHGRMALDMMEKSQPDMVIADIKMPEMNGIELLKRIKEKAQDLPVVIITGYATVDTAVEAMKQGAFDYILKPFPVEVIEDTVERVFASTPSMPEVGRVVRNKEGKGRSKPIIGQDEKLLAIMRKARAVASSKATVLVLGESGTGKEVFARYIHNESDRSSGPFVALNCAALPEGLLESELFGHEKGSFTGAIATKKGKFELADGGTLLLDEIGEIPLHLQAKLLRVLQEEEVDRLGGNAPVKIDVHVVATTNLSLEEAVQKGTFRQDLYYRLNVIPLRLPPLRERKDDVQQLADHFIEKFSSKYNMKAKKISKASWQRFLQYSWPGNVRELENLLERAILLSAGDELEPWDFWDEFEQSAQMRGEARIRDGAAEAFVENLSVNTIAKGGQSPETDAELPSLRDVERQMILQALQKTDNNRTHAAKILGVSVRTLRNKLHEYRNQGLID